MYRANRAAAALSRGSLASGFQPDAARSSLARCSSLRDTSASKSACATSGVHSTNARAMDAARCSGRRMVALLIDQPGRASGTRPLGWRGAPAIDMRGEPVANGHNACPLAGDHSKTSRHVHIRFRTTRRIESQPWRTGPSGFDGGIGRTRERQLAHVPHHAPASPVGASAREAGTRAGLGRRGRPKPDAQVAASLIAHPDRAAAHAAPCRHTTSLHLFSMKETTCPL